MDKPERSKFAAALSDVISRSRLSQWKDVKGTLKTTLWLDSASDTAGKELRKEPCALLQQEP